MLLWPWEASRACAGAAYSEGEEVGEEDLVPALELGLDHPPLVAYIAVSTVRGCKLCWQLINADKVCRQLFVDNHLLVHRVRHPARCGVAVACARAPRASRAARLRAVCAWGGAPRAGRTEARGGVGRRSSPRPRRGGASGTRVRARSGPAGGALADPNRVGGSRHHHSRHSRGGGGRTGGGGAAVHRRVRAVAPAAAAAARVLDVVRVDGDGHPEVVHCPRQKPPKRAVTRPPAFKIQTPARDANHRLHL
jgi:hypothetical protein